MTTSTPTSHFPADAVLELQRLSATISSDLTPGDSARMLLGFATSALGAIRARAILESDELEFESIIGTDGPDIPAATIPAEYRPAVEELARIREPIFLPTDDEVARRFPLLAAARAGGGAVAVLPLLAGDRQLGVALAVFEWQGSFSSAERDLLIAFGDVCAGVIERSRLAARERLARARLSFVSEASRRLAESLDLSVTLRTAAALAIPLLADAAMLDIVGQDGQLERVVSLTSTPDEDAHHVEFDVPGSVSDETSPDGHPTLRAMAAERTIKHTLPVDATTATDGAGATNGSATAQGEPGSGPFAITSPLMLGAGPFGAITLYRASAPYSDEEIAAAEEFARRAARAIENSRLHSDRERALGEAEALVRLNRAVAEARSPDEVAGLLLDEVVPILEASRGGVFLLDAEAGELVAARTRGYRSRPGDRLPIGGTPAEDALRTGATVVARQADWTTRYEPPIELGPPTSASFVVVPLIVSGERLGLVAAGFDEVRRLRPSLLATVRGLIDAGAQAIARATLIDAERRGRERESAVVRLSEAVAEARSPEDVARVLLAEIYERLNPQTALVALLEEAAGEFAVAGVLAGTDPPPNVQTRWPASMASPAADVVRTREPLIVDEAEYRARYPDATALADPTGMGTNLTLPLLGGGRALGALTLTFGVRRRFARAEIDELRALAEAGGEAIERARLRGGERLALALLEAVVAGLPVGVVVAEAGSGRVLHANPALGEILGWRPAPGTAIHDGVALRHPDGQVIPHDEAPLVLALRDGIETDRVEVMIEREDGTQRRVLLDALPVHDDADRLIAGAGIWTDISEQRAAEEAREAFLGILSHELRTPITSILAGSNILSRRSLEAAEADLVADIGVEAERLHWLVENLLVLSRVERGADLRRSDPVLVQHVGRRVLAHEGSRWPERQFEASIPVGLPAASGDEGYIEQILRNLLSNAAKYSPSGSRIDLVVAHEEDGVAIRVLDRGPGFAPSDLSRVFELFYRAPSAVKVAAGAGIGLYTSRVLAEAMGGRIWAANRTDRAAGEAVGAEVGVWLPLSTLDPEG